MKARSTAHVLETRTTSDGYVRRRYEGLDGARFTTIEVPIAVWRGIAKHGHDKDRAKAWERARARDALRAKAVKLMVEDGIKPIAVSVMLDLPITTLKTWRKKALNE